MDKVYIPNSVKEIKGFMINSKEMPITNIEGDYYIIGDGILYGGNIVVDDNLILPDGVKYIHSLISSSKTNTTITLPNSVKGIGSVSMLYADNEFMVLNEDMEIRENAFEGSSFSNLIVEKKKIDMGAFSKIKGLNTVVIKEGCEEIGISSFHDNTSLTEVYLPNTLKVIRANAFLGCNRLKQIDLPEGVTYIGDKAFSLCRALDSITIPESVTYIGDDAFNKVSEIRGVKGSYAETYANENGINFVEIEG